MSDPDHHAMMEEHHSYGRLIQDLTIEVEWLRALRDGQSLEIAELAAENARLRAACDRMMIGGNHIATWRTDQWPEPGTDPMIALETLGAGREYDMWCCWNAIMEARRALEEK